MMYVGGKYRIASHVERLILSVRGDRAEYVEPFIGGAATFSRLAPHFTTATGYDVVPDLVLMWQAAIGGWVPPVELSEQDYAALRHAEPSALRAFAGFGCSFGGKWFGGYARRTTAGGRVARESDMAPAASSRAVVRQAQAMRHARIIRGDYRDLVARPDMVIYADPPYAGTTGYKGTPDFDSAEFWTYAGKWAGSGAAVVVSEHSAPDGWAKVWQRPMPNYLRGDQQKAGQRVEALFIPEGIA